MVDGNGRRVEMVQNKLDLFSKLKHFFPRNVREALAKELMNNLDKNGKKRKFE